MLPRPSTAMPCGSRSPLDAPIFSVICADCGGPGFGVMASPAVWPDVFAVAAGAEAPSDVASFFRQEAERVTSKMAPREARTTRPPVQAEGRLLLAGSILLETIILGRRRTSLPLFVLRPFGESSRKHHSLEW